MVTKGCTAEEEKYMVVTENSLAHTAKKSGVREQVAGAPK
jgi:hypothetical protein